MKPIEYYEQARLEFKNRPPNAELTDEEWDDYCVAHFIRELKKRGFTIGEKA